VLCEVGKSLFTDAAPFYPLGAGLAKRVATRFLRRRVGIGYSPRGANLKRCQNLVAERERVHLIACPRCKSDRPSERHSSIGGHRQTV